MKSLAITLLFASTFAAGQPTWTTPRPIDPTATRSQEGPLIAVSKTGTIAIVCREGFSSSDSGRFVVYRSTDNGTSFLRGPSLRPPLYPDYYIDRPYEIRYDTSNTLWVLWGWEHVLIGGYLDLTKSTNDGISFVSVLRHQRAFILDQARMVIDRFNNIHLLRDSTVVSLGLRIVYTRLNNGDPGNRFDALVPMAPDADANTKADIAVVQDSIIHYVGRIQRYVGSQWTFKVEYSRSLDRGLTFSALTALDTVAPPNQSDPRIVAEGNLVLTTYYLSESASSHRGMVSRNSGSTFSQAFAFGSHQPGSTGRLVADSLYVHSLFAAYDGQRWGSFYNRFSDPMSPPLEVAAFFDSLYGDLAVGPAGGKYVILKKQPIASVLFSSKDAPTSVAAPGSFVPTTFSVQAAPNPFNSSTRFFIDLPVTSNLSLEVYDLLGRLVHSETYEHLLPGQQSLYFTASNMASGIYLARVVAAPYISSVKLLYIK